MPSPGYAVLRPRACAGPRTRLRHLGGLGAAALLLLGTSACGGDDPDPTPSESPSASESVSASPSESASATPSESSSPSASASGSASASASPTDGEAQPGSLEDALLTADEVPGLNAESSWRQGRTTAVGSSSFGWCSRFDALTIGAREGLQRGFPSSDGSDDRAGQQVLDFVDATNVRRAEQVFRGWHRDCRGAQVGPIRSISVPDGTAWWYLSNRPAGDGTWEAFGFASQGNRITVLRMQHTGQDHSYAPGEDPLERAVVTAAAKLG